jgi:hypothetical protein
MTSRELLKKIHQGTLIQSHHPCAACRAEWEFSEFPHFHGSDFGKCVRQVQYGKVVKPERIEDPDTMQFLLDGHLHEKAIVDALRSAGVKVDHRHDADEGVATDEFVVGITGEGKIKTYVDVQSCRKRVSEDEIVIVGHTDGVINDRFLFEAKSVKDWAAKNKFKGGQVPRDYYGQMQCYMNCLDLDGGFLVVKSRHTSAVLPPMFVERNPDFFFKKIKDLRMVIEHCIDGRWHACTAKTSQDKRYCDACKALGDRV